MNTTHFEYLKNFLQEKAAIVLHAGKEYLVETRLNPLVHKEGFKTLDDMIAAMRARPGQGLHQRVIDAMTTNETLFFRDLHPFEALKKTILPELLVKRAAEKQLNIWCMASSSGQEPYSIAMLLREAFPLVVSNWKVFLLASDISDEMLEKTRQGRYTQFEVNRGLPVAYLAKYFEKKSPDWHLKEAVRKMVTVQKINLIHTWPALPRMDLIFLRNVLIYFDVATKRNILAQVKKSLKPDGYLFLGGSESTIGVDDSFERLSAEKAFYHRLKPGA